MRVLILLDAFSLGGAEKQALLFAEWLQKEKKETVEIWAFLPGDGSAKTLCDRYGLKTRVIGYFRGLARFLYPKQIWEYSRLFGEFKPDVLMSYTNQPNLLFGLVWKRTGARYYIWGQQGIEASGYPFSKKADKMALDQTPIFISNSTNGAEFLKRELKVPAEKVMVVYNGPEEVEPIYTRAQWREKLGVKENQFMALMVAHIALRKDHDTMLKAWKIVVDKLKPQGIEPIIVFAGILGEATQKLITQSVDLGVFPYVKFLGNVTDITGLNMASDIHILSSITEGLPNSLLEAMRCGLPVVGTDIPGIREALGPENEDMLSKPKDAEDLANKVLLLATNPAYIKEVGERNKARIDKHFRLEEMCNIHYDLMKKHAG